MQQDDLPRLIAMAAETAGSKSAVARLIAVSPQRLRDYEAGTRACPPEKVALIAHAAKLPADQWLARAVLWRHEGKPDEQPLKAALGKCLRVTGAALAWGFGAVVVEAVRHSTMYRNVKLRAALR